MWTRLVTPLPSGADSRRPSGVRDESLRMVHIEEELNPGVPVKALEPDLVTDVPVRSGSDAPHVDKESAPRPEEGRGDQR